MTRKLPSSASVATALGGAKLHAPAAARNADALCDLLRAHAPTRGRALEIASGTGQHVVTFADALPDLTWQPTDVAAERLASINAYASPLPNVLPAVMLDATRPGWGASQHPCDLIVLVNLLHLISTPEARMLITQAAQALAPGGSFIFYGPFKRAGQLISDGDAAFDADLRSSDPAIGYKDDTEIMHWLAQAGLGAVTWVDMPANNLAFVARRTAGDV